MVDVGVRRMEEESARKRSSAAWDLPEAGQPVIRREKGVASSQYPVASIAQCGFWLLLLVLGLWS
jgi:hypothetical protein